MPARKMILTGSPVEPRQTAHATAGDKEVYVNKENDYIYTTDTGHFDFWCYSGLSSWEDNDDAASTHSHSGSMGILTAWSWLSQAYQWRDIVEWLYWVTGISHKPDGFILYYVAVDATWDNTLALEPPEAIYTRRASRPHFG